VREDLRARLREAKAVEGRSHLLMGATCAVVVDSVAHISGPSLMLSHGVVPLSLVIDKGIFYLMVLLGSLLPDIDNAHSTMGQKFGWVSREIQHIAGHRTCCHSILGLALAALAALGLEQLAVYLLLQRGLVLPAHLIATSHLVVVAGTLGALGASAGGWADRGGRPAVLALSQALQVPAEPPVALPRGRLGGTRRRVWLHGRGARRDLAVRHPHLAVALLWLRRCWRHSMGLRR
jgi:inner membrane protein